MIYSPYFSKNFLAFDPSGVISIVEASRLTLTPLFQLPVSARPGAEVPWAYCSTLAFSMPSFTSEWIALICLNSSIRFSSFHASTGLYHPSCVGPAAPFVTSVVACDQTSWVSNGTIGVSMERQFRRIWSTALVVSYRVSIS